METSLHPSMNFAQNHTKPQNCIVINVQNVYERISYFNHTRSFNKLYLNKIYNNEFVLLIPECTF